MALSIEEYQKIEKRVQVAQQQRDEARGRRKQLMQELKDKYGCETVKEAEAKLEELKEQEKDLQQELDEKEAEFNKKWKHVLND